MKRKIYWKDILRSFTSSKGRFLSILILMMLGSLALVGLKVAPPNMRRTATDYLKEQRTMEPRNHRRAATLPSDCGN